MDVITENEPKGVGTDALTLGRVTCRDALQDFSKHMELKLQENDHKGGWGDCHPLWLLNRIREECNELEAELRNEVADQGT